MAVAGLLMWGALFDERTGLSFARVTVSSNKSVVNMYNIYKAYVSPGSVQRIVPVAVNAMTFLGL
jgi:hypothetical protein